jgi:hypothetical protein
VISATSTRRRTSATFLDPLDEIIEDDPEDGGFIEQIAQAYARAPDTDPEGPEAPLPQSISISNRHSVQSTPCRPLSSNKRKSILSSFDS